MAVPESFYRAGTAIYFFNMKRLLIILTISLAVLSCGHRTDPEPKPDPTPTPTPVSSEDTGITYQLLVYSFCDSDGDGIGDFNGIASKLDYLKEMGVSALWLSPVHPSSSYHGYDVVDYDTVNPDYGTEADFRNLLESAHGKGIKIYLDFVLNHTSKDHPWFLDAKSSTDSKYRDWYIISSDPEADVKAGKIDMIEKGGWNSGEWTSCASGSAGPQKIKFTLDRDASGKPKSITAVKVDNIINSGTQNTGIYLYYGDGKMVQFYSDNSVSLDFDSEWGFLVRTSKSDSWPVGTKYGAKEGQEKMEWGSRISLLPSTSSFDPKDVLLPGMNLDYYHSFFGSWMPDVNYGKASSCENSEPFKALTASADKWINMGVDGFRLDAIKHIYHNASSDENPTFLKKFYDHCNATYKAAGHSDNIYMIGEHFSEASEVAPYYKGLPAYFEFSFWWRLTECINSGNASGFVAALQSYQKMYSQYRADYIAPSKLSNHDEDRAGETLRRSIPAMKLAAAVLLTAGKYLYIYQGEELGYWGSKSRGDAYVRAPIRWTSNGSLADKKLDGQVDYSMLSPSISVEIQSGDPGSILNLYRAFGKARMDYPALSEGDLGYCPEAAGNSSVSAWFRTAGGQKVLVVHNFSGGSVNINFTSSSLENLIVSNGSVTVNGSKLTLGPYSSAVFLQ